MSLGWREDQWVKVLTTKAGDLSSNPRLLVVEGDTPANCPLAPICMWHTCKHTEIHLKKF